MTDKEKALAYDKLLVKAKQIYNKENDALIMHTIEDLFPDLKESEDERTRKAIIALIEFGLEDKSAIAPGSNITKEEAIAWLEKQGTPAKLSEEEQNKFSKVIFRSCAMSFIDYLDAHKYEGKMCVSNGECEDIENAFQNAMWDRLHRYYCKYTGEQDKQKPDCPHDKPGSSTDNPKPRFKPGEWIAHNEANFVFQVVSVGSNAYEVVNPDGFTKSISFKNEGDYHRWTIHDAKEGNVVVEEKIPTHPSPFIAVFKALGPYTDTFSSLCFIDFDGNFNEGDIGHDSSNLHPATKEQREILLKAMIDAGYTIDYETKELKNIKQEPDDHKFHVGEWIVSDLDSTAYCIESISETKYTLKGKNGYHERVSIDYVDKCWHSWTIQDVKDGDVLAEDSCIFIVKKLIQDNSAKAYCCLFDDGDFDINFILGFDDTSTYPATKEQRDHLFSEIKEKGYQWLEETKELKKTEEQNPDKPKFHEGEWIISDTADKDYHICKITGIKDGNYEIESTSGYKGYNQFEVFDNAYRPWTIDEAKDGDVLAAKECYVIFEEITGLNIRCYCTYHYMGFNPSLSTNTLQNKTAFHPATKEESDTLGKAITNAGLKWDAEKKKLMAIKPRFDIGDTIQYNGLGHNEYVIKEVHYPTHYINELGRRMDMPYTDANFTLVPHEDNRREWSEEDEEIINKINVAIATHYSCDTAVKVENWLKSLKSQPGQGWSKEDEVKLKSVCALIRNTSLNGHEGIEEFTIDWIRSLKDRVQSQSRQEWKQENTGDLTDFENAMMHIGDSFFGQHAGLDPNDTNAVKEQANLLLGLIPKQGWSEDDEQYLLVCKNALSKYQVTDKWDSSIISQWLDNRLKS